MPRKRTKKVFTAVVSLLFALSIGYFAVLPPTSAWFYQELYNEERTFIFGTLRLYQDFIVPQSLDLPAATKLEATILETDDVNKETLFDEALHIEEITALNNGTIPARVYLTVTAASGDLNGLHYFFFIDSDTGLTVKDKIASKIDIKNTAYDTYIALDAYNTGIGYPGGLGRYIEIPPDNTPKVLKIAFWADYNEVGSAVEDNTIEVKKTYDVTITLSAGQNTDGWFNRQ